MVDNNINILIGVEGAQDSANSISEIEKRLKSMGKGASISSTNIKTLDNGMEALTTTARLNAKGFLEVGQSLRSTTTDMKRFKMEYLSVLFFSMNAQRQLGRILRSSVSTFQEIAGESNRANQTLAAFGAQFTFLRFTIGRAIGEALIPLLPVVTSLVEWLVDFIDKNPEKVVWGLVGAFAAFAGLNIASQLILFADAIATIVAQVGAATLAIGALKAAALGLGALTIGIGVKMIWDGITEGSLVKELAGILVLGLGGASIGAIFGGPAGALIGFTLGISIGLIIDLSIKEITGGGSIKDAILGILKIGPSGGGLNIGGVFGINLVDLLFGKPKEEVSTDLATVTDQFTTNLTTLQTQQLPGVSEAVKSFTDMSQSNFSTMSSQTNAEIQAIIDKLNEIPREINVTINITERRNSDSLSSVLRNR